MHYYISDIQVIAMNAHRVLTLTVYSYSRLQFTHIGFSFAVFKDMIWALSQSSQFSLAALQYLETCPQT